MVICLDLGATEIKVALVDGKTAKLVSDVLKVPTDADKGKEGIVASLKRAISLFSSKNAVAIAVASAGNINSESCTITYATDNLPGMTGFNFATFCKENFNLPVTVINDAHAALLGELRHGAGLPYANGRVAMLTLGSGVGGAYCVNGKIVSNKNNDFARFGHLCLQPNGRLCTCGKSGCAEMYLSGRALHIDAQDCGVDGGNLFTDYANYGKNRSFVENFRKNLKNTLDMVYKICPFDVCLIGGGVTNWISDAFVKVTENLGYDILKAQLANDAGIYGAFEHFVNSEVAK